MLFKWTSPSHNMLPLDQLFKVDMNIDYCCLKFHSSECKGLHLMTDMSDSYVKCCLMLKITRLLTAVLVLNHKVVEDN